LELRLVDDVAVPIRRTTIMSMMPPVNRYRSGGRGWPAVRSPMTARDRAAGGAGPGGPGPATTRAD